MSIQLRYVAHSHVGLVHKNNRDSGYAGSHLLVLADEIGGPAGDDIASSAVVTYLAPLGQGSHATDDPLDSLCAAIQEAHQELVELSESYEELAGPGTACVVILRSGNKMGMVRIGDSRAYLLRNADLTQVTTDHSFVQYLAGTGGITPEEVAHYPKCSVLLWVLGDFEKEATSDESIYATVMDDHWILCSDGLSGVASAETVGNVLRSEPNPEACREQLVALVLKLGVPGNVTVVVADVVDSGDELTLTAVQVVGAVSTAPVGASIGQSTPTERAAILRRGRPLEETERAPVRGLRRLSLKARILTIPTVLVLLVTLGFGTYQACQWSQIQYFLGIKDGEITLLQGINQSIGARDLYHPVKKQGLRHASPAPVVQDRLGVTIALQLPEEANKILDSWRKTGLTKRSESVAKLTVLPPEIATKPQPAGDEQRLLWLSIRRVRGVTQN